MAQYTIELRNIVENGKNIFNFPYAFYNENKRLEFEERFIKHFYFREIGVDTVDKFIFFLEDKMHTVFPYYNELLKTSEIEYNKLQGYYMKETVTTKRENQGTSSGAVSTVGQLFDSEETTGNETRNAVTTDSEGSETLASSEQISEASENKHSEGSESVTNNTTKTSESNTTATGENIRKFLDTPQGKLNLTDSKYLTNLTQDNKTDNTDTDTTETTTGSSETENENTTTTDSNGKTESSSNSSTTTDRTTEDNATTQNTSTLTGEHKSTSDTNSRYTSNSNTDEVQELNRVGNIGMRSDADMLQAHIKLQKTLTHIYKMFFDECEDLFMLVF